MPGPLDELLMLAHAQRDTPGGDQAWRNPLDWYRMWSGDTGIYGAGRQPGVGGWLGQPGSPAMPSQALPVWARELPIARNVLRDIERGRDPVLTGSGLETTAEDYWQGRSAIDRLLRSLGAR